MPPVEAHVSTLILQLQPSDVEKVCQETDHSLGNVKRIEAEKIASIRDWHPDFAFTHVFHIVSEGLGAVPTWQRFKKERDALDSMLWQPARRAIQSEVAQRVSQQNFPTQTAADTFSRRATALARDAMTWRIGNAYYSFLREMYVLAVLRAQGIDALTHPLADALFRTDMWAGDDIVSLYVGNARFRSGSSGRKSPPEVMLADAEPPFRFRSIELPTPKVFGVVRLPSTSEILDAWV